MILGCPDRFAIYFDKVDCWSNENFNEGFFGFYINGSLLPEKINSYISTISVNIADLQSSVLKQPTVNEVLFSLDKLELCKYLLKKRYPAYVFDSQKQFEEYPDDIYEDEEFLYSVNIDFLSKARLVVFIIKSNSLIRILALNFLKGDKDFFNLSNLIENEIAETTIPLDELTIIIDKAVNYYQSFRVVS